MLAYTTAASEAHLNRLVSLGIVGPLMDRLAASVEQVGRVGEGACWGVCGGVGALVAVLLQLRSLSIER